jgi:hypothetical protein
MKNTILKKQGREILIQAGQSARSTRALLVSEGIPEFLIRLVGTNRLKRVPTGMILKNRHD